MFIQWNNAIYIVSMKQEVNIAMSGQIIYSLMIMNDYRY